MPRPPGGHHSSPLKGRPSSPQGRSSSPGREVVLPQRGAVLPDGGVVLPIRGVDANYSLQKQPLGKSGASGGQAVGRGGGFGRADLPQVLQAGLGFACCKG